MTVSITVLVMEITGGLQVTRACTHRYIAGLEQLHAQT